MAGRWFLGVDWGSRVHALCLLNHEGTTVGQATAPHEAVAFAATVQALLVEGGAVADHVQVRNRSPQRDVDRFLPRPRLFGLRHQSQATRPLPRSVCARRRQG